MEAPTDSPPDLFAVLKARIDELRRELAAIEWGQYPHGVPLGELQRLREELFRLEGEGY